ncbi:unnamed protein product [Closterium sp. NIES-53]
MFRNHSVSSLLELRVSSSSTPESQPSVGNTGGVGDLSAGSNAGAACGMGVVGSKVGGDRVVSRVDVPSSVASGASVAGAASKAGFASVAGADCQDQQQQQ